jgi:hypothetical protein
MSELNISTRNLNGRYTIRLAIGNIATAEKHVARVWELVKQESAKLLRGLIIYAMELHFNDKGINHDQTYSSLETKRLCRRGHETTKRVED